MANDRMLIQCTACKRYAIWGKYYPSCAPDAPTDRLLDFMRGHIDSCHLERHRGPDLNGDTLFIFHTEDTLCRTPEVIAEGGLYGPLWDKFTALPPAPEPIPIEGYGNEEPLTDINDGAELYELP